MPEMLKFCGQRFTVFKIAHKTCDTINKTGGRRMNRAVHLTGLRCDGSAHGDCHASCLLYWKESWLRPLTGEPGGAFRARSNEPSTMGVCTQEALEQATHATTREAPGDIRYFCQATALFTATTRLTWFDPRQYWRDWRSGNVRLVELLRYTGLATFNAMQRRRRGVQYPRLEGRLTGTTPTARLGLKPGDDVVVKLKEEIECTLDVNQRNRGLWFDIEMVPYCGGRFKVLKRVERIINEKTGKMMRLPRDCVILDDVVCSGHLSQKRLFCPRSIYPYWREIWLRRVD